MQAQVSYLSRSCDPVKTKALDFFFKDIANSRGHSKNVMVNQPPKSYRQNAVDNLRGSRPLHSIWLRDARKKTPKSEQCVFSINRQQSIRVVLVLGASPF